HRPTVGDAQLGWPSTATQATPVPIVARPRTNRPAPVHLRQAGTARASPAAAAASSVGLAAGGVGAGIGPGETGSGARSSEMLISAPPATKIVRSTPCLPGALAVKRTVPAAMWIGSGSGKVPAGFPSTAISA